MFLFASTRESINLLLFGINICCGKVGVCSYFFSTVPFLVFNESFYKVLGIIILNLSLLPYTLLREFLFKFMFSLLKLNFVFGSSTFELGIEKLL
jgi:hypothetical protein